MSLVQRVTSIEGTDREPPRLPDEWRSPSLTPARRGPGNYGSISAFPSSQRFSQLHGKGSSRSLRRVISYDALPRSQQPSQATHPTGGVIPYKVPNGKRIGG